MSVIDGDQRRGKKVSEDLLCRKDHRKERTQGRGCLKSPQSETNRKERI